MITVVKAPPFATVQDLGWPRGRAQGIPLGGAMDPEMLVLGNLLVGNDPGDAALEWALGPGIVHFDRPAAVAVCGDATLTVGGHARGVWQAFSVSAGDELRVAPGPGARFVYLAVQGGIATPVLAGSRATYLQAGLGGVSGRRLVAGDRLPVGPARGAPAAAAISPPVRAAVPTLRVVMGPQNARFDDPAREALLSSEWTVLAAADRMGYRLGGPAIAPRERATLPSEAACPGAIQVPDGGEPIVLMPDGPTVGGYPKLAVVARADLALLAQCPPGHAVRFRAVSPAEAREALRERARRLEQLERRAAGKGAFP